MLPWIRAALWRLVFYMVAALAVGGLIGYPLDLLLVALILYALWNIWQLSLVMQWAQRRLKGQPRYLYGAWRGLVLMLRQQRQWQQSSTRKLRETIRQISQLTHAIDEGIVVLSPDLRLQWWNEAASQLLELGEAERGQDLIHFLRDPDFIRYINKTDLAGSLELPAPAQPGRWLLFTASRFGQGDVVLVVTDVTRLKNLELTRKEFVANVSHELRTPLTVLRGYLETLTEGMVIEDQVVLRACRQMHGQVRRMQHLADDLITLSRLESDQETVEPEVIRLRPILDAIVVEGEAISEGRHDITVDCPEEVEVMGLPGELHSAIGNLVVNAIRHNPQGANITIKVSYPEKKGRLLVSVRDDGVGISAEAIPRLTERFYRTDTSRSSSVSGTGLGLAIVKHALNRIGGSLEIRSRLGHGAEFICTLRVPEPERVTEKPAAQSR